MVYHPDAIKPAAHHNAWWDLYNDSDEDLADAMHEAASLVDEETADRKTQILEALVAYGVPPEQIGRHLVSKHGRDTRPRENLVAAVIDSWVAQVAHERPRTMFMTTGGSATEMKRAKHVTSYCDAKNDAAGTLAIRRKCLRDAGLSGLGYYRWYVDQHSCTVRCERVRPTNILLDDVNVDATPTCFYIQHYFSRHALLARWPEHEAAIRGLAHPSRFGSVMADPREDVVEVIEGWHLPSVPMEGYASPDEWERKTDGVHTFGVRGATFFKERYGGSTFPGVFMHALAPESGIWGISLYSRLRSLQRESDKLWRQKSNAMHVMSSPRWAMKVGDFHSATMTNNVGTIVKTKSGQPPVPLTPRSINPDVSEAIAELRRNAFAVAGISEHFATAQKTPNVNSGRQELIQMDNRSQRLVVHVSMYEQASVEGDYDLVKRTRELDAWMRDNDKGSLEVLYERKGIPHRIPWGKLDIDDDRMLVQAFPTSAAMRDPSTKMRVLDKWEEQGRITTDQWARLMDLPEIESEQRLMTATRDWLEEAWEKALLGESFMAPDALLDPELVMTLTPRAILRAVLDGHSEPEVNRLRQWYVQAKKMFAPEPPPPPPGAMGPPGMPPMGDGGPPMPPDVPPGMPPMDGGMPPMGGAPPLPPEGMN